MGTGKHRMFEERSVNSNRWVPFWLPFVIFGIVAVVLVSLGITLLQIAIATHEIAPKEVPSLYVIIVALTVTLIIGAVATIAANKK